MTVTLDTMVVCDDGITEGAGEPLTLRKFLEINLDGIDQTERRIIMRHLAASGEYHGGGGAEAAWLISVVVS